MSNTNNAGATTKKNYVLFVHAKCKGSQEAISMLNGSGLHSSIEVQNVAQIPATMLPQYVTGVPTVVDLRAREGHRGTACVQFLEKKNQGRHSRVRGWDGFRLRQFRERWGLSGWGRRFCEHRRVGAAQRTQL